MEKALKSEIELCFPFMVPDRVNKFQMTCFREIIDRKQYVRRTYGLTNVRTSVKCNAPNTYQLGHNKTNEKSRAMGVK